MIFISYRPAGSIVDTKDGAGKPAAPGRSDNDANGGSFSDFFQSMKSKIVDLNEEVVKTAPKANAAPKMPKFGFDPAADPVFGLRMINPLLSSQSIQGKMVGKLPVPVNRVEAHLRSANDADWVVAGVLVNKSLPKTSQKGIFVILPSIILVFFFF